MPTDAAWMRRAIELAEACAAHGDVPIGAVVVRDDGEARGRRQRAGAAAATPPRTPRSLRCAPRRGGRTWRLDGCTLYVTLEPCAMCAGAIVLARLDRVVFGAADPKAGFAGSLGNLVQDDRLNHRVELDGGVEAEASGDLLRAFFRERR